MHREGETELTRQIKTTETEPLPAVMNRSILIFIRSPQASCWIDDTCSVGSLVNFSTRFEDVA
jgi:hypothetical protein